MPKKVLRPSSLWAFVLVLAFTTAAVAGVSEPIPQPPLNHWGVTAPFLMSWIPIWIFSVIGGVGSIFVKVGNIDSQFRWLYVAKPYLGVLGGLSLCIAMTDGRDPPEVILIAYAGMSSLLAAVILQFFIVLLSNPKNSLKIVNNVSPVQFELPNNSGGNDDKH